MKTYAVRQISTGLFIPRLKQGRRRGGSHLEPSNEREPRLFHNKAAAKAFLGNWLQGKFVDSGYQNGYGEYESDLKVIKQPHRIKEDMEIIEFELVEIKKEQK